MTTELDTSQGKAGSLGPVTHAERALAPDLARGAMLLFIALANAVGVVFGGELAAEPNPRGIERGVNLLIFTFVHARAYPVFAVMFGYGLVQLARRQEFAGATPNVVRSILLRRNAWLVVFGLLHAVLLYFGDFLGAYGLVGIFATLVLLRRGDRVHRAVLWLWALSVLELLVLGAVVASRLVRGSSDFARPHIVEIGSLVAPDYIASMLKRIVEWPVHTLTVLPFVMIVWLGMWAARRQLLEQPAMHRRLLRWVAGVSLGIVVMGGLPSGLLSAGILHADSSTGTMMSLLLGVSGMFGGPGYAALFGLISLHLSQARLSSVGKTSLRSLTALGQRSLSGYLFQSVAWLFLLAPYTLALGRRFGSPMLTAVAIALLVWFASLFGAYLLDRLSNRGPAEMLLRRLTYGERLLRPSESQLPVPIPR